MDILRLKIADISIHKALTGLDGNHGPMADFAVISIHKALTGLDTGTECGFQKFIISIQKALTGLYLITYGR